MLYFQGVSPRTWYIALSTMTSRSYYPNRMRQVTLGSTPSSPAGVGGSTWHWLKISGNASASLSPFLVIWLDWPMALSTNYVFCFSIPKKTFLLSPKPSFYLYLGVPVYHTHVLSWKHFLIVKIHFLPALPPPHLLDLRSMSTENASNLGPLYPQDMAQSLPILVAQ